MRSKEYDAFGPWIYIIDDEHTIPPLFVDYHLEKGNPLLMIKMPRAIDRRNANPKMNLYDYVIGVFNSYLHVLKRVDDSVAEKKIFFDDIQSIKQATCLLHGELFFYLKDETILIEYNTVSDRIISLMIALIKKNYIYEKETLNLPAVNYSLDNVEYLYVNLINSLKRNDKDMNLVAYQPNIIIDRKQNVFNRIINFLFNKLYFQSTAFITNDKELVIIEKGAPSHTIDAYYFSHLFLPVRQIKNIELCDNPIKPELKLFRIKTSEHTFEYVYNEKNIGINSLYNAVYNIVK